MLKVDTTITISIILAICALFAPSITALINNHHHYKIRKLELQHDLISHQSDILYQNKYEAYKDFLEKSGKYIIFKDYAKTFTDILSSTQKALLVCDKETQTYLTEFIKSTEEISYSDRHKYISLLSKITTSFNRELSVLSSTYDN